MITQNEILDILRQGMWLVLRIGGPMLIAGMLLGILVAIFQAATQIHEQTLTFVPKAITVAIFMLIGGSWMLTSLQDFFRMLFEKMVG